MHGDGGDRPKSGAAEAAAFWFAPTALLGLAFLGIKGFEYSRNIASIWCRR